MTPAEKALFKQALGLIANKYYAFIKVNPQVMTLMSKPETLVRFLDNGPFNTNRALTKSTVNAGCTVTGFTDRLTNPPTIYINRTVANAGTIVHELLHYLTSKTFEQSFSDAIVEGTTEYFTRKVLGQQMVQVAAFGAFNVSRAAHYDDELGDVNLARGFIKDSKPKDARRDYMKRAYFLGAKDAIEIFREIVGGRE
jgi:hypothetical protein